MTHRIAAYFSQFILHSDTSRVVYGWDRVIWFKQLNLNVIDGQSDQRMAKRRNVKMCKNVNLQFKLERGIQCHRICTCAEIHGKHNNSIAKYAVGIFFISFHIKSWSYRTTDGWREGNIKFINWKLAQIVRFVLELGRSIECWRCWLNDNNAYVTTNEVTTLSSVFVTRPEHCWYTVTTDESFITGTWLLCEWIAICTDTMIIIHNDERWRNLQLEFGHNHFKLNNLREFIHNFFRSSFAKWHFSHWKNRFDFWIDSKRLFHSLRSTCVHLLVSQFILFGIWILVPFGRREKK